MQDSSVLRKKNSTLQNLNVVVVCVLSQFASGFKGDKFKLIAVHVCITAPSSLSINKSFKLIK